MNIRTVSDQNSTSLNIFDGVVVKTFGPMQRKIMKQIFFNPKGNYLTNIHEMGAGSIYTEKGSYFNCLNENVIFEPVVYSNPVNVNLEKANYCAVLFSGASV